MNMRQSGFTLLEVLIALAILSAVALLVLRATGEGLAQIADNGWKDRALLLGRNQMLKLRKQTGGENMQGSFAPDFPQMQWRLHITELRNGVGRKLALTVTEGSRELSLEEIIIP